MQTAFTKHKTTRVPFYKPINLFKMRKLLLQIINYLKFTKSIKLTVLIVLFSCNYTFAQTWTGASGDLCTNPLSTKVGIGLCNPETLLDINSTFKDEDFISLSYTNAGEKWNYLNLGNNYMAFNARLRNGNWEVDDGSYIANAFQIAHRWGGLDFNHYQHPTNNQGASTQTWTGFTGNWKTAMRINWNGTIKIGDKTITSGPLQGKKVTIDGELVARGYYATANNWADYVLMKVTS